MWTSAAAGRLALAALIAIFVGRIVLTYRVFNDTFDEAGHLRAGIEILERGAFTVQAEQPPLGTFIIAALPYWFSSLRLNGLGAEHYWKSLALARAGNLLFAVTIFWGVYRWSSRLYGPRAGLAACAVVVSCPNLIAHSGLATLDAGSAATVLFAAYFLWRWSEQTTVRYAAISGAAVAIATLCKISAVFFLPVIGLAYFAACRWRKGIRVTQAAAIQGAVFCVVFALLVWAGYLFEVGALVPPGHDYYTPFQLGGEHSVQRTLLRACGRIPLPAHRFLQGVIEVLNHNEAGHRAFLLGRFSSHGWWYYFPVTVAVKTTLPLLALAVLGAARRIRGSAYPLLAIGAVMTFAMMSHLNLGVRYVLAIYPFLAILGSAPFATHAGSRKLKTITLVLLGWHAAESALAHPDYLAYFNQIARGREERFLLDSNLDWGQDLARLGRYTREHDIGPLYLSYFGKSNPEMLGISGKPLLPHRQERGWIAISVNNLMGLASDPADYAWLRRYQPYARIGKSIWLYHLP